MTLARGIIYLAAIMGDTVGDDEIVYTENYIVTAYLLEHL